MFIIGPICDLRPSLRAVSSRIMCNIQIIYNSFSLKKHCEFNFDTLHISTVSYYTKNTPRIPASHLPSSKSTFLLPSMTQFQFWSVQSFNAMPIIIFFYTFSKCKKQRLQALYAHTVRSFFLSSVKIKCLMFQIATVVFYQKSTVSQF